MSRILLHWLLNALVLLVIAHFVEGFVVIDLGSALLAVLVIGLFNAIFGVLLKVITFPLAIVTFGVSFLAINGVVLWFASDFVPGFRVETFRAAFFGATALAIVHLLFGIVRERKPRLKKRRRATYRIES